LAQFRLRGMIRVKNALKSKAVSGTMR